VGDYTIIKTLGSGGTALVKLAFNEKKQDYFALKIIKKEFLENSFDNIQKEISILLNLDHPNIIKIYDV
jgi:serine/threonine protein kinase